LIYIFDTNSLSIALKHYYPDRFPSFWDKFTQATEEENLVSVREGRFELLELFDIKEINIFEKYNGGFFSKPTDSELAFITQIYSIPHFQQNMEKKKLLKGGHLADPFIIAKANAVMGIVVTEEKFKENAAKIPNICKHFGIGFVNLEGFLLKENWKF
jgi:hypothetical protein